MKKIKSLMPEIKNEQQYDLEGKKYIQRKNEIQQDKVKRLDDQFKRMFNHN